MSSTHEHAEDIEHELEHAGRDVGESFADAVGEPDVQDEAALRADARAEPEGPISGSLDAALPPSAPTLSQLILDRIAGTPDNPAFGSPNPDGSWRVRTWQEAGGEMTRLAAGLLALGLQPEERVAIASNTRVEWVLADGAVMLAGGANTTIYPSTGEDDFAYIVNDSETRFLIAEDQSQADKALTQLAALPSLERIVLIEGEGDGDRVMSWAELAALGDTRLAEDPGAVTQAVAAIRPDSLATLIYTSGTTGRPKGVMLPQSNWVFQGRSMQALEVVRPDDVQFLWLPLAHSFGKVLLSAAFQVGFVSYIDGRVPKIVENLPVVRPTIMAGVPRIFEKIYQGANAKAKAGGGAKAKIFDWAFAASTEIKAKQRAGLSAGPMAPARMATANKLVFSKIQALTGGRMRVMISGSAALNGDVARWFDAAGLPIIEGYGLTENSAAACVVRPDDLVFGSVGQPLPGTQVMIASDGEVLLKGPHVMAGYWNLPEVNAETLLPGGWLATGDIGELDDKGRLKITDRKKDLVKTSGGKYIAPGQIAAQFKVISALASNLVVHAADRNFATALISLDPEAVEKFAAERGLSGDFAALSQSAEVRAALQEDVDTLNSQLNRWETIKKFAILPRDLSEEAGELTASLKVKRKAVEEHFADLIEAMYAGE
ncbi:MAG: long-chain fatty acid--CoA ligase [Candidatus Nanopelagicales bacterium]|jgi:long-chain acyl-CoA synthetase|nr:long-chain fatty acid--CoA ligase [Candidatus Nanopelagicales bacterium]